MASLGNSTKHLRKKIIPILYKLSQKTEEEGTSLTGKKASRKYPQLISYLMMKDWMLFPKDQEQGNIVLEVLASVSKGKTIINK